MKHQYFGDISDYRKYCVLKSLAKVGGLNPLVCWLLTPDDERNDGNNTNYLKHPQIWRKYDPDIFDFLRNKVVQEDIRDLSVIEESGLFPNISFYNEMLEDDRNSRQKYFEKLRKIARPHDLIFLDPDNGIETISVLKGKKNSSKYIYLDEIGGLWNSGNSLLIYQHFPRVERISYMTNQLNRLYEVASAPVMLAVKTSFMAYLALATDDTAGAVRNSLLAVAEQWQQHFEVYEFDQAKNKLLKLALR